MKEYTVIEVVKATEYKHLLPLHQLFNLGTKKCAIGIHQAPTQKILTDLTIDGELHILAKNDETGEIEGYVGTIEIAFDKTKHTKEYKKYAKQYSAKYYDYDNYRCLFVVENLTKINEATIRKLLNGAEYLKDKDKRFDLESFFSQRSNLVYLKKMA